jgi:hypothetical protein
VNFVFCAMALSVVSNSSEPSLLGSWTSAAAISSGAVVSLFTSHLSASDPSNFDLLQSFEHLMERERARGRGKFSGWMATDWLRLKIALIGGTQPGAEIGATAILSQQWLSPTLTAEAGHSSGGDAFSRVRVLTKSPYLDPSLIRGFVYDYQAAYGGIEWGAQSFALSLSVGVTRVENAYQSIASAAAGASNPSPVISTRTADIGPAAKLALLIRM